MAEITADMLAECESEEERMLWADLLDDESDEEDE